MKQLAIKSHTLFLVGIALLGLCTPNIESMLHIVVPPPTPEKSSDVLTPLQALVHKHITNTSIETAFENTFDLICAFIVHQHNPPKSKCWLEDQAFAGELGSLFGQIREQLDHQIYTLRSDLIAYERTPVCESCLAHPGFDVYIIQLFQALDHAEDLLHKKIATLICLLDDEIIAERNPDFLYNAHLLHDAVEYEISCWATLKKNCTML